MCKKTVELNQWEKDSNELKIELALLQDKRKQLKEDYDFIKDSFKGGLAFECMKNEALIIKVIRVLNEKFNQNLLYLGQSEFTSEELLFDYDYGAITYFDGESYIELYSNEGAADTFKNVYDASVSVLKEYIMEGYNSEEDIIFYSTF